MKKGNADLQARAVIRWDEKLRGITWPSVSGFDSGVVEAGDVVVLCGGFEERALALLARLVRHRKVGLTVVLVRYEPSYDENRDRELREMAGGAGIEVREVVYDRRLPEGGGEAVVELIDGGAHVIVDISGMSRLLIVQLVVALIQGGYQTTIAYGEADEYSPTKEEFARRVETLQGEATLDFLSSGIFEVAATPELGSVAMLGEAVRLIVFPSLEAVQMKNVLQEVQPTYVDVVYGVSPRAENRWRREAAEQINEGVLRRQGGKAEHEASTLDYRETIERILDIYGKRSMFDRILLAPIGSKMQAVAVGIVRSVLTDIQIVYPTPQHLKPSTYTSGVRSVHQLCIPLFETIS